MITGIYGVIHRPTNRWYVGQSMDIEYRWKSHKYEARQDNNRYFSRAIRKHPADEFTWVVLENCTENNLAEKEEWWIKKLHSFRGGFNSTTGGERPIFSEAACKKMSKPGSKNAMYGRHHSSETKLKIGSRNNTGRGIPKTEEHNKKNSEAQLIRFSNKENLYWLGKHHSQATLLRMGIAQITRREREKNCG